MEHLGASEPGPGLTWMSPLKIILKVVVEFECLMFYSWMFMSFCFNSHGFCFTIQTLQVIIVDTIINNVFVNLYIINWLVSTCYSQESCCKDL